MTKITKKEKIISEKLDPNKIHSIAEAMEIFQAVKSSKFEESIDISIKLGVDAGKSDQNVRGAVTLPNSLGKAVTVAVFADGDAADQAKKAGAEFIGMDDLAEKFTKEEIDVDVVISADNSTNQIDKKEVAVQSNISMSESGSELNPIAQPYVPKMYYIQSPDGIVRVDKDDQGEMKVWLVV